MKYEENENTKEHIHFDYYKRRSSQKKCGSYNEIKYSNDDIAYYRINYNRMRTRKYVIIK